MMMRDPASEALLPNQSDDIRSDFSEDGDDDEFRSETDMASISLCTLAATSVAHQLTSSSSPRSSQSSPQGGVMTNPVAPTSIKALKTPQKLNLDEFGTEEAPSNHDHSGTTEDLTSTDERQYNFKKTVYLGRYCSNATPRGDMTAGISPCEQSGTKPTSRVNPNLLTRVLALFQQPKTHSLKSIFSRSKDTRRSSQTSILVNDLELGKGKQKHTYLCCSITKVYRLLQFLVEDWMFLAILGIIMALLSFGMDLATDILQNEHLHLINIISSKSDEQRIYIFLEYLIWVFYAILLVTASALLVHYIAPQAIGSGIPEMKTILRGVILKEYLTFRTLVSKIIGLSFSLGSGVPIGKEGPFVHIASVVASLLSRLVHRINNGYTNESRSSEMLAAGCAVGVACTFSAPVGGVLFSIEVTSVFFAIRNYWRGFFAATCSATLFRLLSILKKNSTTVVAVYQTNFPQEMSFLPSELPIFGLIGIIAGFMAALFICMQRRLILFLRRNKFAKAIFQNYWFIYPVIISLIVSSITFPDGFGRFIGGSIRFSKSATGFFDTCTFRETNVTSMRYCGDELYNSWTNNGSINVFATLSMFLVTYYFLTCVVSTMPIPAGIFGPAFILGSALGRLVGEVVAYLWTDRDFPVYPGVYAVVGAAAFGGGVTHTVSVAVIVFELTGQIVYILPVMTAVLLANAICSYLQPSIYDSMIKIKHLPYLPDIPHSSSNFHSIKVHQFMVPDVKFLSKSSTYAEVQKLLLEKTRLQAFPIVEDRSSSILIGSCSRAKLLQALNKQAGPKARQAEAYKHVEEEMYGIGQRFKTGVTDDNRPSLFATLALDPVSFVAERKATSSIRRLRKTAENAGVKHGKFQVLPVSPLKNAAVEDSESIFVESSTPPSSTQFLSTSISTEKNTVSPIRKTPSRKSVLSALWGGNRDKSSTSFDTSLNPSGNSQAYTTIHSFMNRTIGKMSFGRFKVNKEAEHDYDLYGEERILWEVNQLAKPVNFNDIVDPAPFQLVECTSLFKVHSLFSLLGLNRAYVTNCGLLVGVVALSDLRKAIEAVQAGILYPGSPSIYDVSKDYEDPHIVSLGAETFGDNGDDSDVENDKLNPRLEVLTRVECSLTPAELKQVQELVDRAAELAEAQSKVTEIQERFDKSKLSLANSDPCLSLKTNKTPVTRRGHQHHTPTKVNRRFSVQPVFTLGEPESRTHLSSSAYELSTVYESPSSSPSILATSLPSATALNTPKKKLRHVQIVVPSTPDDESTDSTHLDFKKIKL